jgi:hypothetical protein
MFEIVVDIDEGEFPVEVWHNDRLHDFEVGGHDRLVGNPLGALDELVD